MGEGEGWGWGEEGSLAHARRSTDGKRRHGQWLWGHICPAVGGRRRPGRAAGRPAAGRRGWPGGGGSGFEALGSGAGRLRELRATRCYELRPPELKNHKLQTAAAARPMTKANS
jgi:hypothetical protein